MTERTLEQIASDPKKGDLICHSRVGLIEVVNVHDGRVYTGSPLCPTIEDWADLCQSAILPEQKGESE